MVRREEPGRSSRVPAVVAVLVLLSTAVLGAGCSKKKDGALPSEVASQHKRQIAYCETYDAGSLGKQECYDLLAIQHKEGAFCDRGTNECPARVAGLNGNVEVCEGRKSGDWRCFARAAGAGVGNPRACESMRKETARLKKAKTPGELNGFEVLEARAAVCDVVAARSAQGCKALPQDGGAQGDCLSMMALIQRDASLCDRVTAGRSECLTDLAVDLQDRSLCQKAGFGVGYTNLINLCIAKIRSADHIEWCNDAECAGAIAFSSADVEKCKAAVKLNDATQQRCRLHFVSLGGAASACATIKDPALAKACDELSRM